MPHPARPKGRKERAPTVRRDTHSKAEVREDKARAKFVSKNKDILTAEDMATGGQPPPQGPYFYQENGKTYFSLPSHMVNGIMNCQHYRQMMKDCESEGIQVPHHVMAKDPQVHIMTPAQYMKAVCEERIPVMDNHKTLESIAEKTKDLPQEEQPLITVLEFLRLSEAAATANPGTVPTTIDSSAQTEDTANFIVSKDTLVAYTISVIQQTLDYHFGQMSIVYQSAHNSAMQDTPSRAEQLANEHFNIALLTDQAPARQFSNDPNNTPPPAVDPTPTTSSQETIPKSVDQGHSHPNKKSQPTGTVPPTCRSESGLCDGIPAGYETDDSWGCHSPHANPEDQIPDLEEELLPFLTLRAWRNQTPNRNTQRGRPRGRGGIHHHRQQNQNIPVRDGYDQPPRPWESRPYGRRTRSQRALQE